MERRRFTREFKLEAARLIRDRGVSYAQSQDLKVHPTQLRNWVKAFADDPQHAFPGQGQMKPEQLESGSNDGHTLTSGTFGTVPRRGGVSSPRGPYGSAAGFLPSDSGVAGLSSISPVAILPTMTAAPITSAGRFSPLASGH